jgi:hypothetical protein
MSWRDCWCHCHSMVPVDRISDRIAAASACPECTDDHVQKYVVGNELPPKKAEYVDPPAPADATGTTEDDQK